MSWWCRISVRSIAQGEQSGLTYSSVCPGIRSRRGLRMADTLIKWNSPPCRNLNVSQVSTRRSHVGYNHEHGFPGIKRGMTSSKSSKEMLEDVARDLPEMGFRVRSPSEVWKMPFRYLSLPHFSAPVSFSASSASLLLLLLLRFSKLPKP